MESFPAEQVIGTGGSASGGACPRRPSSSRTYGGDKPRRSLASLLSFFLAGCVATEPFQAKPECPPTGSPCHVVTTWKNQVYFTPDPTRGGTPTPGLVGRLYLFGKDVGHSIGGKGDVVVQVFDCTHLNSGRPPTLLEDWRIDKDTLQRLQQKDAIGWGYTLFLPWATYRPDIRTLQFRVRYEPQGAPPLYGDISQVMLQDENRPLVTNVSPAHQPGVTYGPPPAHHHSAAMYGPPPNAPQGLPHPPAPSPHPGVTYGPPPTQPYDAPRSQSFNLARQPDAGQRP